MAMLRPPGLNLPDHAEVRWTSSTKIIRQPEENWPAQICVRPIIAGRAGARTIALIADPEAAKAVLGGPEEQFPKWRIYDRVVGAGTGRHSLSTVTGAQWQRQRRTFAPMFRPTAIARLVPLFYDATIRAVAPWGNTREPECVDAYLEMTRLTLGIVWRVLFGADSERDPPPLVARAAKEIHGAQIRGDVNGAIAQLAKLADGAARQARSQGAASDNPFDDWGAASCDLARHDLTRQELYDNARAFLAAGHETTALTLTWALWLVAQDAETQQRLHDEIDDVVGGNPIDDAHTDRLAFTGQVLSETLRLFPPAIVTVRQTRNPIVLAGEDLPAATVLAVCIYALHRHRDWWRDPGLFDPDRFALGSGEPRHHYAFLPFSAGRHACIGAAFGWKEVMTIFATILQRFSVRADPAIPIRPQVTITLRPDRAVPIFLHRR